MKKILIALLTALSLSVVGVSDAAGTLSTKTNSNIVINAPSNVTFTIPTTGSPCLTLGCTMTGSLILAGAPTMANEAATKNYVDSLAGGLIPIDGVVAGSTANLTATYANGTAGVGATLTNSGTLAAFSIDGVSPSINSRILIKNQTTAAQNGIYTLTTVGSGAVAWVLTRATDYDTAAEIKPGTLASITSGTVNAGASWYETATVVTVGTDPVNFSVFFSPAGYLQKANNLSDVASASTSRTNLGLGSIATHPTTDFISAAGTVVANDVATFTDTTGTAVKDSAIQLVTYGSPTNLFMGAGGSAGNPSIGIGARNIGIGASTLINATSAIDDISIGYLSSSAVTSGGGDTMMGSAAGSSNQTGNFNSIYGIYGWQNATSGDLNSGIGYGVLQGLVNGSYNTGIGQNAGANYTGSESSNIDIASLGVLGESHTLHIGSVGSGNGQITSGYWGNVSIPLSTSINTILYNSAANQIAQITPVNSAVVITGGSGIPSESTTLPSGLTIPGYATTGSLSSYLPLAGGTMSGAINMGSHLINAVTDPASAQDAATKNYVDTSVANYLPLVGGALTGDVTNTNRYLFKPATLVTTMSQTGILATITGVSSAQAGGIVVPASGSPFTIVSYQGTSTVPTNVSQTIAGGTACTIYYFPNGTPLDSNAANFGSFVNLFANIRYLTLGAGAGGDSYINLQNNTTTRSFSSSTSLSTAPNNSSNQTASQSGTTITGTGTSWDSSYVGHMIRFATGSTAFITAVASTTSMTAASSQTVATTDFDIPGKTNGVEATVMDGRGNLGTNNAYINNSLILPTGYTLTTNISGNAATVTTNANLTGDVTSTGNATTYNNAVPLSKSLNANLTASNGGIFYSTASAGAILSGTATAGKVLQSGATAAPTWSTPTYPSASGSAGKILSSDGTNNVYSTSTYADTYGASTLLYSNGANTVQGLATANNGTLITSGAGVPSISSTLPSAVQNNITAVNSSANTLSIGGSTKTFVTGAVNIPSVSGISTFTPGLAFGGGVTGITYASQIGFYTSTTYPNGAVEVHVWGSVTLSNKGSSTGNATLTGLPISTGANGTANLVPFTPSSITVASGALPFLQLQNNNTIANIDTTNMNGGVFAQVNNTQFSNSSLVAFNFSYWNN